LRDKLQIPRKQANRGAAGYKWPASSLFNRKSSSVFHWNEVETAEERKGKICCFTHSLVLRSHYAAICRLQMTALIQFI